MAEAPAAREAEAAAHAARAHRRLPDELGRRYLLEFDTDELAAHHADVLVVGSGIAGLTAALGAAAAGLSVDLVTKARVSETNTWYAQGGIAGAVGEADSVELHLADTLVVGAGLCDEAVVRAVVSEAPGALADLERAGVDFDYASPGHLDLHREGGHSLPRVLHSGDATGAEVQNTLSGVVRRNDRIHIFEERFLTDLLTAGDRCAGAVVHDPVARGLEVYWADAVILATGGGGQLYRVTTNPSIATADGVAAAWRAGAEVADLEFVQFHPTAFDSVETPTFLITEALRGAGAYLLDCEECRFMVGVHPLAELAPRDIVSREIEKVMARCGRPNVWLDARHLGEQRLRTEFPTVWEKCSEAGFDLSSDLVPVAPAAHYMIGGVRVDLDGRTSLKGLYASGEVSCSGLHGANRLASNSLLEGLVFSRRIIRALAGDGNGGKRERAGRVVSPPSDDTQIATLPMARDVIRRTMSEFVGVTRHEGGLATAASMLEEMAPLLDVSVRRPAELELQNMLTMALLTTHAAWYRTESRGTHWRSDHPVRDDAAWRAHVVWRRGAKPVKVPVEGPAIVCMPAVEEGAGLPARPEKAEGTR